MKGGTHTQKKQEIESNYYALNESGISSARDLNQNEE
jgi:hypothetical protein